MERMEPKIPKWSEFPEFEFGDDFEYALPARSGRTESADDDGADTDIPITPVSVAINKKNVLLKLALFLAVLAIAFLALFSLEQNLKTSFDANGNAIVPDTVIASMNTAIRYAYKGASNFNGKWGDWHKKMIASGEEKNFSGYETQVSFLQLLMEQSQATNVYIIYNGDASSTLPTDEAPVSGNIQTENPNAVPSANGEPSTEPYLRTESDLNADLTGGDFRVSIDMDGGKAFGQSISPTAAIIEAWNGKAAADPNPWDYAKDKPVWTAYAPIYDRNGEIVAILCVDYPVPLIRSYPEWNKSSKRWNGYPVLNSDHLAETSLAEGLSSAAAIKALKSE